MPIPTDADDGPLHPIVFISTPSYQYKCSKQPNCEQDNTIKEEMGNQPSVPKPDTEFQVIGAGLPRTGTASFSEALRILLDGPVYHGGTQVTLAPDIEIRSWIQLLSHWPTRSRTDSELVSKLLRDRVDGYAAATDSPTAGLGPELLELYPNAKVICTIRDPESWEKSMAVVASASTKWFLRVVLFPIPTMRHFVDYINALRDAWIYLYGEADPATTQTYYRHIEWLKKTVPEDRLFFYDVKDGWEPLCKALDKPVPKDIPFPRINDAEAIDRLGQKMFVRGMLRWLAIFATGGIALIPFVFFNV